MKRLLVVIGVLLVVAALAYARAPKDYQVTGPVLEMDTGSYRRLWDSRISAGSDCDTPCKIVSLNGRDRKSFGFDVGIGRINYHSPACYPCPNSLPRSNCIALLFCYLENRPSLYWKNENKIGISYAILNEKRIPL